MNIRINWPNPKLMEISERLISAKFEPGPQGISRQRKAKGSLHQFGTTAVGVN